VGDYSKAKRLLAWEPKFTLEEGLRMSVEYWRHKLSRSAPRKELTQLEKEKILVEAIHE